MTLTLNDYYVMQSQMTTDGGSIEYEKDGNLLFFDYEVEVEGYTEDDYTCGYGNGTGAYICTDANVKISEVHCYNSEGEEIESNFDENKLARMFEHDLIN